MGMESHSQLGKPLITMSCTKVSTNTFSSHVFAGKLCVCVYFCPKKKISTIFMRDDVILNSMVIVRIIAAHAVSANVVSPKQL